jgi:hypothetical protein
LFELIYITKTVFDVEPGTTERAALSVVMEYRLRLKQPRNDACVNAMQKSELKAANLICV